MNHTFRNFKTTLFEGFYESDLYNSDTLYCKAEEMNIPEGYELDVHDFKGFENEVGEKAVEFLRDCLEDDDVIHSMSFKDIDSPSYYNFETDKLLIDINFNEAALKEYCLGMYVEEFADYLRENYTSYDGFTSFVPNNVQDFKKFLMEKDGRAYDMMLEFYLIEHLDEYYREDLANYAYEILEEHFCLTKDGKDYSYSCDDEDNVIVGEELK